MQAPAFALAIDHPPICDPLAAQPNDHTSATSHRCMDPPMLHLHAAERRKNTLAGAADVQSKADSFYDAQRLRNDAAYASKKTVSAGLARAGAVAAAGLGGQTAHRPSLQICRPCGGRLLACVPPLLMRPCAHMCGCSPNDSLLPHSNPSLPPHTHTHTLPSHTHTHAPPLQDTQDPIPPLTPTLLHTHTPHPPADHLHAGHLAADPVPAGRVGCSREGGAHAQGGGACEGRGRGGWLCAWCTPG